MPRNLKGKAIYTSLTKGLNIFLSFTVQFVITPIILNGLGKQLYGVFVIVNKLQGYISMVDLRPTAILRYKLASLQESKDLISKKKYVGASIVTSLLMFPFIVAIGWVLSVLFNEYFKVDEDYIKAGQYAIIIISVFIGLKSFLGIPEAIIRGNNLEYKAFFIEPIRLIFYGGLVYLFLNMGYGLLGVIAAIILAGIIDFFFKIILQNKLLPGYFPIFLDKNKIKEFLGQGSWYLSSSFFYQIMSSLDIVMIGVVYGAKEVAIYSLSKAMLFRASESVVSVIGGITSGVGHLISANKEKELINIREKLFRVNLILGSLIVTYFILFNRSFVTLWVDQSNFIGEQINFILCLAGFLTLMCLSDDILINSLQIFQKKSKVIIFSVIIYTVLSLSTIHIFGLIAIPFSFVIAKFFQWFCYQVVLQKAFSLDYKRIVINNFKILIFPCLIFSYKFFFKLPTITNWVTFLMYSMMFLILFLAATFFVVVKKEEISYLKNIILKK